MNPTSAPSFSDSQRRASTVYARLHAVFGWWSLLAFLTLGIVLEAMHGFKVGWYLDVGNEQRRLMWTLAHTHGTLLSLVNICFAWSVSKLHGWDRRRRTIASRCLLAAGVLMPAGFLLGGVFALNNDPGLGILLVPPGALLFLVAVLLTALAARDLEL